MDSLLVIGAGISGLAAARTIAQAGKRVTLIEARDRVGGRIHTLPAADGGLPIELGAEFIHGLPPELIDLVEEAGLNHFELEGEFRCYPPPCADQREVDQLFDQLGQLQILEGDLTFHEFVTQRSMSPEAAARAINYVEGFNAADAHRISLRSLAKQQAAEDAISGDRLFRVVEGYSRVPAFLLQKFLDAGGEWVPSSPVQSVDWQPGQVSVATSNGRRFEANAAVITLPLAVLQAKTVTITPRPEILSAADRLAMGHAARVVYEFDSNFSSEFSSLEGLSFLFAPGETPPTWWTTYPWPSSLLTGWMAGRKLSGIRVEQLPEAGLATLATILGINAEQLRKHLRRSHLHDWQMDPWSQGAYTYVPSGAIHASDALSVPVEGTLFFAGEHTDTTGHWGTVHGALRSGYRAANQVLQSASS